MANETILVVDDAPVNLKLTDILLRKEGYKVHAANDAEQAIELLRTVHPDLMLVDIQLPGMNGLDLTRRIKQDSRTSDIVVVALTACAMMGDDDKAFTAGCDGYISKPIETLTLAGKIREYLAKRATPARSEPEPEPSLQSSLPSGLVLSPVELEALRRRFLEDGLAQCRDLLESLDRKLDVPRALGLVRGWISAAKFLDYQVLSILASDSEKLLRVPQPDRLVLCDSLSNVMVAFLEPPEATMGPVPDSITKVLKGKSVALVGCANEEADRLCAALDRAGAKPRLIDIRTPADPDTIGSSSVVVIHVRHATLGSTWLHPLTMTQLEPPLVLIGMRDHLLELEATVPVRANELLIDGWQPEEALMRISHALARGASASAAASAPAPALNAAAGSAGTPGLRKEINRDAEILIADDDVTVRMLVRSAIQGAGIKCRMACDGQEALQIFRDCRPPAAILDVNMPGMDGYEVLATVRAEGIPSRVIMLTAHQHEEDITRSFNLGADDYVVKPFNPAELLARLKRFL